MNALKSSKPVVIAAVLLAGVGGILYYASRSNTLDLAPFFPTPMVIVNRMLELAKVGPDDLVYDLGCGDGRIVTQAAELYGASGVCVEYDPPIAQRAIDIVAERRLEDKVRVVVGDALKVDAAPATVVTIYLLPKTMPLVRSMLDRSLKPGTRVVSHDWEMPGWTPLVREVLGDGTGRTHTLWLYEIGKQY